MIIELRVTEVFLGGIFNYVIDSMIFHSVNTVKMSIATVGNGSIFEFV